MVDSPVVHSCSCNNSTAILKRPATEEEEAWLQWEDYILQAVAVPDSPLTSRDEEAFNPQNELSQWNQAEAQNYAVEEAELVCGLEEEKEQQLAEMAISKKLHQYLMMKSLVHGATYLTDIKALEDADLQELTCIQQAAKALTQLVHDSMHAKMEEERLQYSTAATRQLFHKRGRKLLLHLKKHFLKLKYLNSRGTTEN